MRARHQRDGDDTGQLHAERRDIEPGPSAIDLPPFRFEPEVRRVDAEPFGIDSSSPRFDAAALRIPPSPPGIGPFRGRIGSARSVIKSIAGCADALSMATVPKGLSEKVAFFQTRLETIVANAVALGLTPEDVARLQEQVDIARAALIEQKEAQAIARAKTAAANEAVDALGRTGATILETVRATAAQTGNPELCGLALIPQRAQRSPIDVPGKPSDLRTELRADGSLRLKWRCDNPRGSTGTVYQIYRRSADQPLKYLGCVGEKQFVDGTIPKGATVLFYEIQAVRSTKVGESATFLIPFGSNSDAPKARLPFGYTPRRAIATSLAA